MFVIGYLFIMNGKIETTIFDKRTGKLIIYKTTILCDRKIKAFKLEDITNIRAVQRGTETR